MPGEEEVFGGVAPSIKVSQVQYTYEGRIGEDVLYPNNMVLYRSAFQERVRHNRARVKMDGNISHAAKSSTKGSCLALLHARREVALYATSRCLLVRGPPKLLGVHRFSERLGFSMMYQLSPASGRVNATVLAQ